MRLKLMFEWGGGALWADDGGPVEEELPLSPALRDRLEELGAWHDTALDWDYPPNPSPWPPEEFAKFETSALEVLDALQRELGDGYEVVYVPLG